MDWIEVLYSDVIPWLLEPSNPSVRYWTMTRLLGRPDTDPEVVEARRAIMTRGPAAEILAHYDHDGRWEDERSYYTHKYTATHWQLLLLAELAADGRDERISLACHRMIEEVYEEDRYTIWPCFHGNLIGYLHALGYAQDERVVELEEELQRAGSEENWRCEVNDDLPCAWGIARGLWGLGQMPAERQQEAGEAIEAGVRFLGRFKLREGNYPASGPRHKLWNRISFPLFYQSDVLFTLRGLVDVGQLGAKPTFRLAVEWLEKRRRDDGRWDGTCPFNSRMWTPVEANRQPSKWITCQALHVIKTAQE